MNIKEELNSVFCDVFNMPSLRIFEEMTAADVDDWDSITHISLVIAIEDHFQVKLSAADVANLKNVGEMIALLQNRLG